MKPLYGHVSAETAYLVEDYPYGFNLRCKMRCWIEYKPKKGFRFWTQTTNPKKNDIWNKPKASTYVELSAAMYLDDQNHVQWIGVGHYSAATAVANFVAGFPEAPMDLVKDWCKLKAEYCRKLAYGVIFFTMNGKKIERSEEERTRDLEEAAVWESIC